MQSLTLVTEPFCQVAIDIVGPWPRCKDSGNRFILTVLDLCTHFPEAIPLRQHTAQDVAKALTTVGEKVLVLLPVPVKPLQAKYHGPYTVLEQLGPVDYVIATPDRRKVKRVCHVNLLKSILSVISVCFPQLMFLLVMSSMFPTLLRLSVCLHVRHF